MIKIKTPCVGICSTGIGDDVCRGCKRYAHEVISWNSYQETQKQAIEARLVSLLTRIIQNKWLIVDEALLQWQIQVQPIMVSTHRNLYCQSYELLKAGASQIKDVEQFGLRMLPESQGMLPRAICDQIDSEFYALSVAHYERYFKQVC